MPTYGYLAFDLRSGDILGDLDATGVKAKWALNDPGDLGDVTVPLGDLGDVARTEIRSMTVPWRHGIALTRDRSIVKAACVTTRRYNSTSGEYRLGTTGILGYWRRRVIARNLTWTSVDQFDMVRDLLALGGTTIPLVTAPAPDSGILRDRTYSGGDLKVVLDAVQELGDNLNGFDIAIDTIPDPDSITPRVRHHLLLGHPHLGRIDTGSGLMTIEWPDNTVGGYDWDEDGEGWATHIFGSSQTDAGVNLVRLVINESLIDAGWPRIDKPLTFSNISDADTLDEHLEQAALEATGFTTLPAFTVRDDGDTAAGSWAVGDHVRVRVTDERRWPHPPGTPGGGPGLDITLRLQEATLDPAAEQIVMTMAPIITPVT